MDRESYGFFINLIQNDYHIIATNVEDKMEAGLEYLITCSRIKQYESNMDEIQNQNFHQ